MKIQVIGAGCETCDKLYEHVREAVAETGCDAEVEKVEDLLEIVKLGVMSVSYTHLTLPTIRLV